VGRPDSQDDVSGLGLRFDVSVGVDDVVEVEGAVDDRLQ
jgi:hypothetical protein